MNNRLYKIINLYINYGLNPILEYNKIINNNRYYSE